MTALENMIVTASLNLQAAKLIEGIQNNNEFVSQREVRANKSGEVKMKFDLNATEMREIIPELKANSRNGIPNNVTGTSVNFNYPTSSLYSRISNNYSWCSSQDFHSNKKTVPVRLEAYRQSHKNSTLNSSRPQLPSVGVI